MASPSRRIVLYERDPSVPDNHVDPSFWGGLQVSRASCRRSWWSLSFEASNVSQQLCTAVADLVSDRVLFGAVAALSAVSLGLCALLPGVQLGKAARQCMLLTGGVALLSPLLLTLTQSVSGDTLVATSAWLLLAHLFLHPYQFETSIAETFTGSLSLAAAIFASTLTASRMRTALHVCVQMLFSFQLYIVVPLLRQRLRALSPAWWQVLTACMELAAAGMLTQVSRAAPLTLLACVGLTGFVAPWWLVGVQKHKLSIAGPWDTPEVTL